MPYLEILFYDEKLVVSTGNWPYLDNLVSGNVHLKGEIPVGTTALTAFPIQYGRISVSLVTWSTFCIFKQKYQPAL